MCDSDVLIYTFPALKCASCVANEHFLNHGAYFPAPRASFLDAYIASDASKFDAPTQNQRTGAPENGSGALKGYAASLLEHSDGYFGKLYVPENDFPEHEYNSGAQKNNSGAPGDNAAAYQNKYGVHKNRSSVSMVDFGGLNSSFGVNDFCSLVHIEDSGVAVDDLGVDGGRSSGARGASPVIEQDFPPHRCASGPSDLEALPVSEKQQGLRRQSPCHAAASSYSRQDAGISDTTSLDPRGDRQ